MKNFQLRSTFAIAAVLIFFAFGFKNAGVIPEKITICHTPPGNPGNCQSISVSIDALQAHLDHGDNLICDNEDDLDAYRHILRVHLDHHPDATTQLLYAPLRGNH